MVEVASQITFPVKFSFRRSKNARKLPLKQRVSKILARLDKAYPGATTALAHQNALQLLVATILSAQCTDERVNQVTRTLFQKYRTAKDFAYANPAEFEQEIRPTGFFRNKAKAIIAATKKIVADFAGNVPRTMEEMLTLPGVARKTANVVLGTAYGIPSGVVVDTHVHRLAHRLHLSRQKDPKKIELDLMRVIPKNQWIFASHQMIWHGRLICQARQPRCLACPIEDLCFSKDKTI